LENKMDNTIDLDYEEFLAIVSAEDTNYLKNLKSIIKLDRGLMIDLSDYSNIRNKESKYISIHDNFSDERFLIAIYCDKLAMMQSIAFINIEAIESL